MPLRGQICDRQTRTPTPTRTHTYIARTFMRHEPQASQLSICVTASLCMCVCVFDFGFISQLCAVSAHCPLKLRPQPPLSPLPATHTYQLPSGFGHLLTDSGHAAKDNISDLQALALCKSLRKSLQGSSHNRLDSVLHGHFASQTLLAISWLPKSSPVAIINTVVCRSALLPDIN